MGIESPAARLLKLIDREIESVEASILNGACPDYPTYRGQASMLAAYRLCRDFVKKTFTEVDDDDGFEGS